MLGIAPRVAAVAPKALIKQRRFRAAARAVPDPYISVIVTAHDRRRYLPEALRSLERQTLDKSMFEVVVVKNFEDPVSDDIIRRNGWKNIVTDVKPLGGKIAIGIQESRGEVITFLEDDDLYVPERLQVVEKKFREVKDLVYFHNAQVVIDEEGNVVPPKIAERFTCPYLLNSELVVDEKIKSVPCSLDYIQALTGAGCNNSSIAIRRDLLKIESFKILKALPPVTDWYFYASAFASTGSLYLTPLKLTVYRLYFGSTSGYLVPWTILSYLQEGKLQELKEQVRISRLLNALKLIRGCPAVHDLTLTNSCPYNIVWQCYMNGIYDWITYSLSPLSIGRIPLPELLKVTAVHLALSRRRDEFVARLLKTVETTVEPSKIACRELFAVVSYIFSTVFIATLKYLTQFLPKSVKERYLDLSFRLRIYKDLEFALREALITPANLIHKCNLTLDQY